MRTEGTIKQEQILDTAIRRFAHFGIHKTTMTEIADDLALSKQSLSYYFPDKQSLIEAVAEKIIEEYNGLMQQHLVPLRSVREALLKLVEVKREFVAHYFMLFTQVTGTDMGGHKAVPELVRQVQEQEAGLLAQLLRKGAAAGEIRQMDYDKTARLVLDMLVAIGRCIREKTFFPDRAMLDEASAKQKEVIELFYNGLKA